MCYFSAVFLQQFFLVDPTNDKTGNHNKISSFEIFLKEFETLDHESSEIAWFFLKLNVLTIYRAVTRDKIQVGHY